MEHFDKVRAKENALKIIRDDLRRKTRSGVVGTGVMSDPKITVTTADDELAAKIEPRVSRFCIVWMILSANIKDLTGWSRCRCSFVRD